MALEASAQEMGTVKWYNAMKGFRLIVGIAAEDVFVHASALPAGSNHRLETRGSACLSA